MQNLKNPKNDMMLIAMAGPASNMFLAFIASIIYRLNFYFQFSEEVIFPLEIFIQINIVLAIFNLLPLNPLDGSRILPLIVKNPRTLYNIEVYGPRVLIGLIILNLIGIPILSTIIFTPVSIIFYFLTGA
jgi:Zn-dependent protease